MEGFGRHPRKHGASGRPEDWLQIDTKKVEERAEQRNRMDNDLEMGVQGCSEAGRAGGDCLW